MENRKSGLIGHPLGHSISPVIHSYLGKRLGINTDYTLMDTEETDLDKRMVFLKENDVCGVNVTIPYKTDVIKYLSDRDEAVEKIGACNSIVIRPGSMTGYNTDHSGLKRALDDYGIDLKDKRVAILGAGGASKAVRYLCEKEHAREILQFNRTVREGVLPLKDAPVLAADGGFDVVFQSTSVGMYPKADDCIIDDPLFYGNCRKGFDLVYNPFETSFMKRLKEAGGEAHNGLRMLLYQGVEAFKLFNDVDDIDPSTEKDCYLNMLIAMNRVLVLCGMMGCGKSTTGRRLCNGADRIFIDTDDYIVKKTGMSINDIFATQGEAVFRQMEHEALSEIKSAVDDDKEHEYVISLGGGMCTENNIPIIRSMGATAYLRQDAVTLAKRLEGSDDRPLLKDNDNLKTIRALLEKREDLYMEAADEIVDY